MLLHTFQSNGKMKGCFAAVAAAAAAVAITVKAAMV